MLEKRAGFKLVQKDVFLNIAGGLKVNDPAIDLAVISAILSSSLDISIEPGISMCGRGGAFGRDPSGEPYRAAHPRSGKIGFLAHYHPQQ